MDKNICFTFRTSLLPPLADHPYFVWSYHTDKTSLYAAWDTETQEIFAGDSIFDLKPATYETLPKQLKTALNERLPLFQAFAATETLTAERNKLYWQCVNNDHMFAELPDKDGYVLWPQETLPAKEGKVTFAVSYTYNGGMTYRSKWYKGYKCEPPIVPRGYKLVDLAVGLQFNSSPPRATYKLERIKCPQS
jgi:hypothetical protein